MKNNEYKEAINELKIFVEEYENYMKNRKKEPLKSFEIIKKMYVYFVKHFRTLEPKLMICEKEDFDNVETALEEHELMKQTKIIVDKKISDDVLEKLKNQRILVGGLEQCEIKTLFDEETQKKLKALEVIKECFVLNGFDELIPNSKWFDNEEKQDLLREFLK